MGQPYVGEIRLFGGNFAPAGWALCEGQLMPISENDTLFTLIGTTYGGDGQETFGLPNLCGRAPMHQGQGPGISQNYQLGEWAGAETVTLTTQQIPSHNHAAVVSGGPATADGPTGKVLATPPETALYFEDSSPFSQLNAQSLAPVGGSQPHENMQPYLAVSYIISLWGVFPHQ